MIKELKIENLDSEKFIGEKINEISSIVGDEAAINALSGGIDSSTVTMLGHKALGTKLHTYFIDNGLMREKEPEKIASIFKDLGIKVNIVKAQEQFLNSLKEIRDPERKREAITRTFYRDVFGKIVRETGIKYLLQGTNYTDIEETLAGIKRQHNVLEHLGINTEKEYGYKVIEPLAQLRKPAVIQIAQTLNLPSEICERSPFPGPALAARIIGDVTSLKIETIRKATKIVEEELSNVGAFQVLAILHENKVTGIKMEKRELGQQIEVRCWDSIDAKTASPTELSFDIFRRLTNRIVKEVPRIVSVTYNITPKPPSTIEAI